MDKKTKLRLFQAGDLPGRGNNINYKQVKQLVDIIKEKGWEAWGYSHKPICKRSINYKAIKYCNDNGVIINLSADSFFQADELFKFNIAPIVITLPENYSKSNLITPNKNKIKICPSILSQGKITCNICGGKNGSLCGRRDRKYIIGFPAHGIGKKKIKEVRW